jgi:hypothetical protein
MGKNLDLSNGHHYVINIIFNRQFLNIQLNIIVDEGNEHLAFSSWIQVYFMKDKLISLLATIARLGCQLHGEKKLKSMKFGRESNNKKW